MSENKDYDAECTKSMVSSENVIFFIKGKKYKWRWPTDEELTDFPGSYTVFESELTSRHYLGIRETEKHFD